MGGSDSEADHGPLRAIHRKLLVWRLLIAAWVLFVLCYVSLGTALAQPPVPHDEEEDGVSYENCVACHHGGKDGAPLLAVDHIRHDNGDCRVCHSTTGMGAAPPISHPVIRWEDCRGCHERWDGEEVRIPNLADSDYDHTIYDSDTCASCHAVGVAYDGVPRISCGVCHPQSTAAETVHNGPESWVDCVDCHEAANHYPHDAERMRARDEVCTSCHYQRVGHWTSDVVSADKRYSLSDHVARGDPHARVDCAACHLRSATIERDPATGHITVVFSETAEGVPPDDPEVADIVKDVNCYQRCHFSGNTVTAPAAELPPRGILCLSCHSASPVVGDSLSGTSIGVFALGMVLVTASWLQGFVGGQRGPTLPARIRQFWAASRDLLTLDRLPALTWTVVMDGVLGRELFRQNKRCWFSYACMLVGIAARAALGVSTWLATLLAPVAPLTQFLVNKNSPALTLISDGLGLLVIVGVGLSILHHCMARFSPSATRVRDGFGVALVGSIFLVGFVVEGARILISNLPPSVIVFSFVGYPVSLLLKLIPLRWGVVYGWLWYVHAGLVAALVAYLPFSKFIQVLVRPVTADLKSALEKTDTVVVL